MSPLVLTPVMGTSYWRVKMAWTKRTPRYFGKFDTKAAAERWIAEHRWLTEQPRLATDDRGDDGLDNARAALPLIVPPQT